MTDTLIVTLDNIEKGARGAYKLYTLFHLAPEKTKPEFDQLHDISKAWFLDFSKAVLEAVHEK